MNKKRLMKLAGIVIENFEDGHDDVRETTNILVGLMDDQMIDPRAVADACLRYMSAADVAEMARMNELIPNDWDDDDEV